MSAHSRRDGFGCRSTGLSGCRDPVRHEDRASHPIPGSLPRPKLRSIRIPASSDPGQGKSCASVRSGVVRTSPPPISLAEHRVEFGVGPDRADFLRAAAGDGDFGSPFQRLLA